jgi:Spy/CpxP family protein refolding chaperone
MKKRTSIIVITILAALALVAAPLVFAGPHGKGMRGKRGHGMHGGGFGAGIVGHIGHLKQELGLSDAQADQIRTIFREVREQNAEYRESMHGGFHDALQTLLANPNDLAAAQAALERQAATEKAMKQNLLNATSKALNVLTPEQRTKLSQHINERMERRRNRTAE